MDEADDLIAGRYRLLERVGEGGMAEVWRAESAGVEGFRKQVAVKRIHTHLAHSDTYRAMFIREACLTAVLDHPNIVQVFDLGEDHLGLFLVMEWVKGVTLKDVATLCSTHGVRMTPALTAAIGINVLRALEGAHGHIEETDEGLRRSAPIIHRDISPSNVLLSVSGSVKLADFGLARALDKAGLTPDGIVKGKLAYLAPESLKGSQASPQTDIYAVGVLLWEALANRRLFGGKRDAEIVQSLVRGDRPPPMLDVAPEVPKAIGDAVDKALRVDPAERHASASVFARALSDALRRIPERTDATRMAREFQGARDAYERLMLDGGEKSTSGSPYVPPKASMAPKGTAVNSVRPTQPHVTIEPARDSVNDEENTRRVSEAIPLVQSSKR